MTIIIHPNAEGRISVQAFCAWSAATRYRTGDIELEAIA